ncbi:MULTISPECIES: succinate dehydrogenase cytochrome b subunit [unclassified Actinomyces]|uniref:succinate dehydrogenase cytochrome b subunit n=1 Tax=unclassified Actinomyces TaxID=2609248 RepID=UPI00201797E3|nr:MULTISPECIES: succinate dehydrogenase cytochrome b subunit [unclassified Actinomyces]MCL3776904.1 succinate dehydrogenase cytochrome b subunit [Actinomyces sp. AC-20-1]MCL3790317.1 succinate dehydrogenase cytochrome b subunit [Actinomyces sp. 187325]MCL3792603.1 succinate dehydrogenase cytochrome b subunit [Actinomyces sp. 186855]MCL3794212.1 succinate dehydrogenase cytochrome b subunit [Actinomyces sp. 217892]
MAPATARRDPLGDAPAPRPVHRGARWTSNAVLKPVAAVTGTVMGAFVLVHMLGNLKVFQGADAYNSYAAWLRDVGYPLVPHDGVLWALRAVLATCLLLHVASALTLRLRGRRARGVFRRRGTRPAALGAGSMTVTGGLLLVFVAVHLLDLTIGRLVSPGSFQEAARSGGQLTAHAYENLLASLSRPGMAVFYTLVMLTLGLHLAQGLWTVAHDLGATGPRLRTVLAVTAVALALAVAVANGALPLLILTGVLS